MSDLFAIEQTAPANGGGGLQTAIGSLEPGQGLVAMKGAYAQAIKPSVPRELARIEHMALQEAALAGEAFYYGWGAGKDRIEGKTEALSFAAARLWGNCAVEAQPIQDVGDAWMITSAFVDLETGFTYTRPYRMSKKWKVYGRHDEARKEDIRFAIGASKSARNVILKALPSWLTDRMLEAAKKGTRDKIQRYVDKNGLAKAADMALDRLAKLGVREESALSKFAVVKRSALRIEHLVVIQGDIAALDEGRERPSELYPEASAVPVTAADFDEPAATQSPAPEAAGYLDEAARKRIMGACGPDTILPEILVGLGLEEDGEALPLDRVPAGHEAAILDEITR